MSYYSGRGKVFLAERDTSGNPKGFFHIGNVPNLVVNLEAEVEEHIESVSGNDLIDARLSEAKRGRITATAEEWSVANLELLFFGESVTQSSGTATNEVLPLDIAVGQTVALAKQDVSTVVITDSTGSPKTLPSGQYTVNAKTGSIQFNDITTGGVYVQPFKASYSYAAGPTRTKLFSKTEQVYWLRFEGLNKADSGRPCVIELYKVSFDPAKQLQLIQRGYAQFPLEGAVQQDDLKTSASEFGQFGRIILI